MKNCIGAHMYFLEEKSHNFYQKNPQKNMEMVRVFRTQNG